MLKLKEAVGIFLFGVTFAASLVAIDRAVPQTVIHEYRQSPDCAPHCPTRSPAPAINPATPGVIKPIGDDVNSNKS